MAQSGRRRELPTVYLVKCCSKTREIDFRDGQFDEIFCPKAAAVI